MKKLFSLLLVLLCLFVSYTPVSALGLEKERVTLFESDIELKQDTKIIVNEKIHYYFPLERHGIYRDIPTSYKVLGGFRRPTIVKIKEVKYYPSADSSRIRTDYQQKLENGYSKLKIGREDEMISGNYVFEISYTIDNLTNYFDDHDEIYQNITGNYWTVPFDKAVATITLPGNVTKSVCYTGVKGSTETNCIITDLSSGDNHKIVVEAEDLQVGEGLTVALAMPKGTLLDTRPRQKREFILANIGIFLPIPVIVGLYFLVKKNNKNKKLTVIPHYDAPKKIYPLLATSILRKQNISKGISAEIIQLAVSGYIRIEQEGKKKYILHRIAKSDEKLSSVQKSLLDGIFNDNDNVNIKDLKSSFYKTVASITRALDKEQTETGYIDKKKVNLKNGLFIGGFCLMFVSGAFFGPAIQFATLGWVLGFFLSAFAISISGLFIDVRTKEGNKIYYELQGLKKYINTAEKRRIEFHDDPKKYSGVFEKLLPYAIIFGLEKKWIKEFEDIYQQPDWYQGDFDTFNTYMLTNSISNLNSNIGSSVNAYSSSDGGSWGSGFSGGSSGGGGGGGGGGSW
ncbi:MAG: DUF2207 domain-containing protein [Candidatus Dojkabacteria bacterium]|jgi:uncharacterized membrane protein YgcG